MSIGGTALLLVGGCIIPDKDIQIEGALPENQAAVRIVERAPMTPEMLELCERNLDDPKKKEDEDFWFCPQVPNTTVRSGLVRPADGGDFCICPDGDLRAIDSFEIYAEDVEEQDDASVDTLYGMFLLDPDPGSMRPQNDAAFRLYWDWGKAGERIALAEADGDGVVGASVGREPADLFVFHIDDGKGKIDLCNPSSGESVGAGLHELVFMVTDRQFFDSGIATHYGVPDLAAGATYDTAHYVFQCRDPTTDDAADCRCEGAP